MSTTSTSAWWLTLALCVACTMGCGPPPAPTVALGPFPEVEGRVLFERTARWARDHGYRVDEEDLTGGRLVVTSRVTEGCDDPARFVVTFHRPSSLRIVPTGCGARRDGERVALPDGVYRDYVAFAGQLLQPEDAR